MERSEIIKKIKCEIEVLSGKSIPDENYEIFTSGYLDSLNVLHIITFLEVEFGISVNPFDLSLETLGSVNKIVDFIELKI